MNRTYNNSEAEIALFGEMEVFRIVMEEGKCYEHVEATREEYKSGFGNGFGSRPSVRRYFTTNKPEYVGEYLRNERRGSGDDQQSFNVFKRNNLEYKIESSFMTCFIEVPCRNSTNSANMFVRRGGKRKTRSSRKKSKKTRRIK